MESQEQFETFALSVAGGLGKGHLVKGENGEYLNFATQCYWDFWQGSRAAVVVELPPKWNSKISSTQQAWDMGIDDCKNAIEAAGLKVKP